MTTGYDSDGHLKLRCVGPPDDEIDGFYPTAFAGAVWQFDEFPTYALGVNDFSIETWMSWCQGNGSPGADILTWVGMMGNTLGSIHYGGAFRIRADQFTFTGRFNDSPPGGVFAGPVTMPPGWHYGVLNFDRSGNLEVFFDTVGGTTVAINANDMGTMSMVWGCSSILNARNAAIDSNLDDTNWWNGCVARWWIGPTALHNRLLTSAEISDSFFGRKVQNLSGVTQILWDPKNIEGHTGWETRAEYIAGHMRGGLHLPFGAPTGTYGTVIIPDTSGNGNNLPLPVAASYQNAQTGGLGDGSRARCVFIADPWWK